VSPDAVHVVNGITVEAIDNQADEVVQLDRWAALAAAALDTEGVTAPAECNLLFVDADTIAALKAEHLGGDGPTDVLAFPIDDAGPVDTDMPRLVGDIVICPSVARRNREGRALDDELALLVVHGVLHLLGHDHAEPDETHRMKEREQVLLGTFHRP